MDPLIITGAAFGSLLAWAISKYFYDNRRRAYLRDTTDQMKRSSEIQAQFYATMAMHNLNALKRLESGQVENTKGDLAFSAANFYHFFCRDVQPTGWIQLQMREIELHAQKSSVLRAALERKPNDTQV